MGQAVTDESIDALVIGAGPAGLMAAEVMGRAGRRVVVVDAKPSPARKFLMAGKSGLNLLNAKPLDQQIAVYAEAAPWLAPMLHAFGPAQIAQWAQGLGVELFTGSSGRIFPVGMKASPLLRAWLRRLDGFGVSLRTNWRWQGGAFDFDTPEGPRSLFPRVAVLAMGGASWARLGSDGAWAGALAARGVALAPFQPANMGFQVAWSPHMAAYFGAPVKSVVLRAGTQAVQAECVVSAQGIEGGGVYALARALRDGASLTLDLFPDIDPQTLATRLSRANTKDSAPNRLRKALGLTGVRLALVMECARPLPTDPLTLAATLKSLPIPLTGPRPMDQAISTAGGVTRAALTDGLMLRHWPNVYCAGEMLDWEAPTGGYLLTACLATGHWAGTHAART